ncbi:PEP-CTERM sorting domain-containing protein [Thalassotalea euphylliae]|uniref:PEP-CTERM sorting domain-containing protein n=1 Tax=Thalassotalea euphylliae TaxID=1655234 RepID=A0A3E0TLM1_9GAMM|nr:PEP-CTERM sorting domain-containing protein [Thalassotalea euphylliae]REL25459.1 PEP-CTERM sorting domain-containing protein [Thalassotalea euphylliae]
MTKLVFIFSCLLAFGANAGLIVNTTDFIDESNLTHFNGFEGFSNTFKSGKNYYEEDGIQVRQIFAQPGNDIALGFSLEGERSWYPNGGDYGYTEITMASGAEFTALEFLFLGPNLNNLAVHYSLWNDGQVVFEGALDIGKKERGVLGFEGGGFDQLFVRSGHRAASIFDRSSNGLNIDSIQVISATPTPVPEPSSIAILALGLVAIRLWKVNSVHQ